MQTEQAPSAASPIWFLIAFDSNLVLRLLDTLDIGEGQSGELVLNPEPEESLLQLQISDRELWLQVLSLDQTLAEGHLPWAKRLAVDESTTVKLNLPHNSLIIAPDFVAGHRVRIDREIVLQGISPPAVALQRLAEPVMFVDQASQEQLEAARGNLRDPEEAEEAGKVQEVEDSGEVENAEEVEAIQEVEAIEEVEKSENVDEVEKAEKIDEAGVVENVGDVSAEVSDDAIALEAVQPPRRSLEVLTSTVEEPQPEVAARWSSWRTPVRILLAAAAVVAVIFVPVYLGEKELLPDTPDISEVPAADSDVAEVVNVADAEASSDPTELETPDRPVAETASLPAAAQEVVVVDAPEVEVPQQNTPPDTPPAIGEVAAGSTLDPDRSAVVESLLAQAQMLYDANSIISPIERNAVKTLIEVLAVDPENQVGLSLMYLCAARLLEQAQTAYDAGDYFVARNLLEEILWFHPEFEEARALQRVWSSQEDARADGELRTPPNSIVRYWSGNGTIFVLM